MRARWTGSADLTLWHMDAKDLEGSARKVNAVYNDAWSDNWNAVPVSDEEAIFIAKLTKPILRADWTSIAEWRGEPVGVLSLVPDINEAIADLKGKLFPLGWAKLMWRLKVAGVSRARVPLIGVRKKFRGTRIGAMAAATLLADAVEKARGAGISRLEISWMLEDNRGVLNLVESLPATRSKTWRIFSRAL
jgi:GNAT superfamily N-acetyltransferase